MTSIQSETGCASPGIHPEALKAANQSLINDTTASNLARTFQALSDSTRLRMISILAHNELCVCDLAAALNMTQSAVSHQLRLLRDLYIVKSRREGRVIFYSLDDEHVRDLFVLGLKHMQHRETGSMDQTNTLNQIHQEI